MDINTMITNFFNYATIALFIVAVLTVLTNIIVEVFKGMFTKLPTNILVFIVAIVITGVSAAIAISVLEITVMWYYAIGALILGIIVAYSAMGNFDKLKEIVEKLKSYKT